MLAMSGDVALVLPANILACEKRHAWAIPVVYRVGATDRDRSSAQVHSPDPLLDGIAG